MARLSKKKGEAYDALSYKEKRSIDKKEASERLAIGLKEVIIVEPMVISYSKHRINNVKSEKLETVFCLSREIAD